MNIILEMPDKKSRNLRTIPFHTIVTLMAFLLFVAAPAGVQAQGITGSITGTISDQTGALVGGATVTVQQQETNNIRTTVTSEAGTYTITQLAPGHYDIKVEKSGFKSVQQKGVELVINQVAVVDAALAVGSPEENVEVSATSQVIQTEDSSVGRVIDSQAIKNTPLNGRLSVMGLIALSPGVQGVGAQDQLAVRGLTYAVGTGSRNAYGGLGSTLDGVINKEITLQRAEPEVPSLEAISQFKVLTTGAPAEFNEPSQVIIVTASGTNQYHGGVLWFNRSKGTSAKPYFGAGKPRPPYERNEYGGNFNGPIWLPGYNGKNRSFFFVAFEGLRLDQSASLTSQMPTTLQRQGIFTEFGQPIIDPSTGLPFSNQTIPVGRQNTVSLQLLNLLYPHPTQSGTGTNTFELVPYSSNAKRTSVRIDHKISDKDQIRGTVMLAYYGPNPDVASQGSGSSLSGGFSGDGEHNSNFILGWTHTFTPSMLIDAYASYFHLPIYRTPQNYKTKWESIIPGLSSQLIEGAPQITITNITPVTEAGSKDLEQAAQANTAITKVLAHHTIKTGFGYVYDNHWNQAATTPQRGQFVFNGQYSQCSTSFSSACVNSGAPWAFADFLLGLPATTAQGTPGTFITRNTSHQWSAYVQDDWKVIPRLTLNIGIRYDLQWFTPGPYGESSLFVPGLNKVVVFGNSYPASAIPFYVNTLTASNQMVLSSQASISNNPFSFLGRPNKNFAPRFGFAYSLGYDTVIRGAFGIYFNLLPASYVGSLFGTLPFVATQTFTNSKTYSSAFTMNNPFGAAGTYSTNPSVNAQHSLVTPYTEEYNLAMEHLFRGGFAVRVGYVGQHNIKQNNYGGGGNYAPNINLADPPVVGATVQSTNLHQPFASIPYNLAPIFHSNMNSMQAGVHKAYSYGLAFGVEYQWTRILGTENLQNPSGLHPQDSYGPIGGITPQTLQVNYSYGLPLGKGQPLFGNAGNTLDKFISGWVLAGITAFQTGQPFSVTFSAPGSPIGLVSGRANRNPGVSLYPSSKTNAQWFNPSAFSVPQCYNSTGTFTCTTWNSTFPTSYATYGNSGYNMLRGPYYQSWDMSLQKNTKWMERYNLQLRADSFNIFNHPNFSTPNSNISNSNVGTITATSSTPTYEQRTIEFAMRFNF